jgi:PAS domain S-box-containing protein
MRIPRIRTLKLKAALSSSLRMRLIAVALVSAMPVAAVMVYTSLAQRHEALQEASASTVRLARLMALDQQHLLDGAAQVLTLLAHAPEVVERQADRCTAFVTVTRSYFPEYDNLGAVTPDGDVFCSALSAATTVNVGDRPYFVRAVRTGQRTAGVNHAGRIRRVPIISLLQPAIAGDELRAVAFVTMDLVRLEEVLRAAELLAGTRAVVFAADGRVLAHVPTLPDATSARVDPVLTAAHATNRDVALDAPGLDGAAVVWGISPVRDDSDAGLTVAVGIPRWMLVAPANAVLAKQLITLAIATTMMIGVAWVVGDAFVRRRIATLIGAARALATGTAGARTGLSHDEGEFGQLAQTFDDMADALERRHAQLGAAEVSRYEAEMALEHEAEFLELVLEGARGHAIFMLSPRGRVVSWHAGAERVTGFAAPDVVGIPFASFLPAADGLAAAMALLERAVEERTTEDERLVVRADGAHIVAELTITALWDGTALRGFTVVMRDVTERRRTEARLEQLSRKLLEVQETEKGGIARELHDQVGQMLTGIKINFQGIESTADPATVAKHVRDGIEIVDGLLRRVRDLSLDLRPSILDDWGLVAALLWSAERTSDRAGIVVDLATEIGDERFPFDVETACFRVFQEAVTNALRHGHARRIAVELEHKLGALQLFVRDDGTGFDASAAQAAASRGKSLGLLGMAERVRLAGGVFAIDSAPGRGTWIRATFPLPPRAGEVRA